MLIDSISHQSFTITASVNSMTQMSKDLTLIDTTIALRGQEIQNLVREVGMNPNYWYPVAWSNQLKIKQTQAVVIWQQSFVLYRDTQGLVHALDNVCPHAGVELHHGEVNGNCLTCPYHGWKFDSTGKCVEIPYFPKTQKLPRAQVQHYPTQEKYGLVWLFPGDLTLCDRPLPDIPEYGDANWLMVPVTVHFHTHFSLCLENTMDVFHSYVHRRRQNWFNSKLSSLRETEDSVCAEYQISFQSWLSVWLGLSDRHDQITQRTASYHYQYPYYRNTLDDLAVQYPFGLPIHPNETKSFSLLFLKLPLPKGLVNLLRPVLVPIIRRFVIAPFQNEDIFVMESAQRTYETNSQQRMVEVNPAILALQRVIVRQFQQVKS